jgi:hypothetical protein
MAQWEYRVITINTEYEIPFEGDLTDSPESREIIETHLDELGRDGWELVSFLPAPATHVADSNRFTNRWIYHAIFKRLIRESV